MIAIITLSNHSRQLGLRLQRQLKESQLYSLGIDYKKGELNTFVANQWAHHPSFIFIMATGIVVRSIAGLLQDKLCDPAVLVVDDQGRHVIPLLSGHLGGANRLAREIAAILHATPVITTASDLRGYTSFDDLAGANGWFIEGIDHLKSITQSVLDGKTIYLYSDLPLEFHLPENIIHYNTIPPHLPHFPAVVIGEKIISHPIIPERTWIILRPKNITVGIGCRKGTSAQTIIDSITEVFASLSLSIHSLAALATIPLKKDENGLLEAAKKLNVPIKWIEISRINHNTHQITQSSDFVKQITGVAAVSEPAAKLACKQPVMLLTKKKIKGVTLSIAKDLKVSISMPPVKSPPPACLKVVGIGSGGIDDLSLKALNVLKSSDIIIGYQTYIQQLKQMIDLEGKKVISFGMTEEIDRCRQAIARVKEGFNVSLISGGDPGVYGMSGPLFELWSVENCELDVEVIPGITAATAAAARLGAPLTHDFSIISLSDRLTPWRLIKKRLNAAASSDMVIVLYNPRSKGRPDLLRHALQIVAIHRSAETPVGIVTNASRPKEAVIKTTLDMVPIDEVTMSSTVIIGNSQSRHWRAWIITPRGYLK
jgi:cobalt-precorrin 5A hydrolase / precorrin-3B C17-methyltransferase